MAKKAPVSRSTKAKEVPVTSSPVRNSAIPKVQSGSKVITNEMIARRAYEISQ